MSSSMVCPCDSMLGHGSSQEEDALRLLPVGKEIPSRCLVFQSGDGLPKAFSSL